jgi:hypothetical protein
VSGDVAPVIAPNDGSEQRELELELAVSMERQEDEFIKERSKHDEAVRFFDKLVKKNICPGLE